MALYPEGEVRVSHDYQRTGEPPVLEFGSWEQHDGRVVVQLVGQWGSESRKYSQPTRVQLEQGADGLVVVGNDNSAFASEGLTLQLQEGQPILLDHSRWQLRELSTREGERIVLNDPAEYTLEFSEDGRLSGQADCNRFTAGYFTVGTSLYLTPVAATRAMCPEDSLSDRYLQAVNRADSFRLQDRELHLSYGNGSGTMRFILQGQG